MKYFKTKNGKDIPILPTSTYDLESVHKDNYIFDGIEYSCLSQPLDLRLRDDKVFLDNVIGDMLRGDIRIKIIEIDDSIVELWREV
jgi:hypothetical protein